MLTPAAGMRRAGAPAPAVGNLLVRTSPEVRGVAANIEAKVAAESISALEGSQKILAAYARAVPHFPWARH